MDAALLQLLGACGLGFLLGMRHALEPDHLAAVATLVAERPSARHAVRLGASWGLGHAIALGVVAGLLAVVRGRMSPHVSSLFELAVAVMLVVLGARALLLAVASVRHGDHDHPHGAPAHLHVGGVTLAARPLLVGLMHGLAGSGALTALALARMPTLRSALAYVIVFGVGSLAGMGLLSVAASWPLGRLARSHRGRALVIGASGAFACALGLAWGWPEVSALVG